jgi:hypothetical protein
MSPRRVKVISGANAGRTGVVVRSIGMCYDVRMDDNGEILSGGKPRWKRIPQKKGNDETTQHKTSSRSKV